MTNDSAWPRIGTAAAVLLLLVAGTPAERIAAGEAATAPPPETPYVVVIGTAQDGGIPHAACDGPYCRAARRSPERGRLIASLAIVLPNAQEVHLIDVTPDIRPQLDRLRSARRPPTDGVDRSPLDGVFLTHAHIG
ncbi:MAG: hypothetical protein R3244_03305, partial [Thermoanaerobaculia bacterium]|nr:hypothetical protein [Thermoanaerobaculia bacterium]